MKFNGSTFNKAQQDQLKKKVGAELDAVVKKVEDVDARMLNYTGDWVTNNEYHENDVVTWGTDGHLYEVIKAHTSSSTIDPSNTEYYKAMTARKVLSKTFNNSTQLFNFLESMQYEQIKYLSLNISGMIINVLPQSNKRTYSSTIIYSNDGAIRHILLSIYSNSVTSFYVDVAVEGARTVTSFRATQYTLYYEA